jgi:pyridoxamine 5'-phosphate oxidase family protein
MFTEKEIAYMKSQMLGRIATVSPRGQPDVVPVSFEFDGKDLWVGSHSQEIFVRGKKYLNVTKGNSKVALVVDDLESIDPWKPRSLKIYGTAEIADHNGRFGPGKYIRISPKISWSMGINDKLLDVRQPGSRQGDWRTKTIHA